MRIGYACHAIAVPGSEIKACTLKNADPERLLSLVRHNLDALDRMIDYNMQNGIALYRISSDLVPFGSSAAADLTWPQLFADRFSQIGEKIIREGMRVSMHPGQYTVLNSPLPAVVERAVQDLDYHAKVLDALGLGPEHKLILHLGGVHGDKELAKSRFVTNCLALNPAVRRRLVLENDAVSFNIRDVLETATASGIPAVFDNLHHAINPADTVTPDADWIRCCSVTWKTVDGLQKIHYSQQHPDKRPGAHSDSIQIEPFLAFYRQLEGMDLDIMLEVKDKNRSAVKCINCVSNRGIHVLETEWAKYKYWVLERSAEIYGGIRQLLNDKKAYPSLVFYHMVEKASGQPVLPGNAINAAQHVWGYFKDTASEAEKKRFISLLEKYSSGEANLQSVKNHLLMLSRKYKEEYLLNGYYLYKTD